jgi:hypothetical protein
METEEVAGETGEFVEVAPAEPARVPRYKRYVTVVPKVLEFEDRVPVWYVRIVTDKPGVSEELLFAEPQIVGLDKYDIKDFYTEVTAFAALTLGSLVPQEEEIAGAAYVERVWLPREVVDEILDRVSKYGLAMYSKTALEELVKEGKISEEEVRELERKLKDAIREYRRLRLTAFIPFHDDFLKSPFYKAYLASEIVELKRYLEGDIDRELEEKLRGKVPDEDLNRYLKALKEIREKLATVKEAPVRYGAKARYAAKEAFVRYDADLSESYEFSIWWRGAEKLATSGNLSKWGVHVLDMKFKEPLSDDVYRALNMSPPDESDHFPMETIMIMAEKPRGARENEVKFVVFAPEHLMLEKPIYEFEDYKPLTGDIKQWYEEFRRTVRKLSEEALEKLRKTPPKDLIVKSEEELKRLQKEYAEKLDRVFEPLAVKASEIVNPRGYTEI